MCSAKSINGYEANLHFIVISYSFLTVVKIPFIIGWLLEQLLHAVMVSNWSTVGMLKLATPLLMTYSHGKKRISDQTIFQCKTLYEPRIFTFYSVPLISKPLIA